MASESNAPSDFDARRHAAEIFGAFGIAITQPLLDLVGRNAELLIARRTTLMQAFLLALGAAVVVPAIAVAVEVAVARIAPRAARGLHRIVLAFAFGLVGLQIANGITTSPVAALAAAIAATIAGFGLITLAATTTLLRFLAAAPPVFIALFLFFSPVTDVVIGDQTAARSAAAESDQRVVLIVFDELPLRSLLDGRGNVDAELYPNFARLEAQSTWYRNTTTAAAFTQQALPAILTGYEPTGADTLPVARAHPDSLFTRLNGVVEMNVHETATQICPESICAGSSSGGFFELAGSVARLYGESLEPGSDRTQFDENAAARIRLPTARRFIASLGPASNGRLDMVHLELPHWPWQYTATLQDTGADNELPGETYLQWPTAIGAELGRQRHLLQLQASDTLLGAMLDRLDAAGITDDSLVIVTADHGVSFKAGEPLRNPSEQNLADVAWVPLFVKYPGQAVGTIDERRATTLDIVPTVLRATGVDEGPEGFDLDGFALQDPARRDRERRMATFVVFPTPRDLVADDDGRVAIDESLYAGVQQERAAPIGGDPALRIFRHSAYGDLIGRTVAPAWIGDDDTTTIAFESPERLRDVDRDATIAPWFVNIASINGLDRPVAVAIVLNGRIAAVSETLPPDDGTSTLVFNLPPALIVDGDNTVEVYRIDGLGPAMQLHRFPSV